jgi:glycolate dehydrogenase FAD-binding subunit
MYDMPEWTIFSPVDRGVASDRCQPLGDFDMSDPVLDALVDICGPDYARAGRSVDAVGGHRAALVAVPATAQAASDILRLATDRGLRMLPRGSGSKIDWGRPPTGVDLLLDTARLGGIWNHDVGAATAEVGTGTPVRALQAALALRGQRLPVDPPSPTATIGGMLAVNESGPLRLRRGTPAEHVDRIAYVDRAGEAGDSDGEAGRPGISQVTGVITSATMRLEPLPASRRWVGVPITSPLEMRDRVEQALDEHPRLAALEIDLPGNRPGTLAALFEDAEASADALAAVWGTVTTPIAPPWWGRYPFGRSEVALRVSTPVFDLAAAVYALGDAAGRPVPVRGSAGLGSVHGVLPGDLPPDRLAGVLDAMGHVLLARTGRVAVVSAPPEVATRLDMASRRELF